MSLPRASMRLQFNDGFTFRHASALVPYFAALGVSHIYASPIMAARPQSSHGYDVIDPTRVSPQLGGEEELRRLVGELRRHKMGLIVDIVPNHMAATSGNAWWMDVLAEGRQSRYAKYFDINWNSSCPQLQGKIMLPVLGRPYGKALQAAELKLFSDNAEQSFIRYFDHAFPLNEASKVLAKNLRDIDLSSAIGRERMHELLQAQHYRLAWWRSANDQINWRRFFDINELVALRVEDDEVFEAVHGTLLRLYAEGVVDGVRVDHVDGLSQPAAYCRKLRRRLRMLQDQRPNGSPAGPAYCIVEMILAEGEAVPVAWQTDGTTGYDFMDEITALLHDQSGESTLRALWARVSGRPESFADEAQLARRQTLLRSFCAQHEALVETLVSIAQSDISTRDYSRAALRRCVAEILAYFPVYRIYARVGDYSPADHQYLSHAVAGAKRTCLPGDRWLVDVLGEWLLGGRIRPEVDSLQAVALVRFQQLSASLCAKAVEDTAFYRYGRLISRNDVGFDAERFACLPDEFHRRMQVRAESSPHAMLTTATHDHKRGEDVRARLAVLSELADEWADAVGRWLELTASLCSSAHGVPAPSAGDRTILFQTIVGAWPLGLSYADRTGLQQYRGRLIVWQQKAIREAKLHGDWTVPDEAYEQAASQFIQQLFGGLSNVLSEIEAFARRIAPAGASNGLAQILVKMTAPGVPDTYQGTDYWDLSLVDPDNRSPVDFAVRQHSLARLTNPGVGVADLGAQWDSGHVKQFVIARVLALRKNLPTLFSDGTYLPIEISGPLAGQVMAFARTLKQCAAITVFRRLSARFLTNYGSLTVSDLNHTETQIVVPTQVQATSFLDVISGVAVSAERGLIPVRQALTGLPVALLVTQ